MKADLRQRAPLQATELMLARLLRHLQRKISGSVGHGLSQFFLTIRDWNSEKSCINGNSDSAPLFSWYKLDCMKGTVDVFSHGSSVNLGLVMVSIEPNLRSFQSVVEKPLWRIVASDQKIWLHTLHSSILHVCWVTSPLVVAHVPLKPDQQGIRLIPQEGPKRISEVI